MDRRLVLLDALLLVLVVFGVALKIVQHGLEEHIRPLERLWGNTKQERVVLLDHIQSMLALLAQQPQPPAALPVWRQRLVDLRRQPERLPSPASLGEPRYASMPAVTLAGVDSGDVWTRFLTVAGRLSTLEETVEPARALRTTVWEAVHQHLKHLKSPVVLRISEDVLHFPTAEDVPDDTAPLTTIFAEALTRVREGYQFISIEGHCDNRRIRTPRFPSNWELSQARALYLTKQLTAYLVERGLQPGKDFVIGAAGFGEWRPIASNATPEEQRRNRRLEIVFMTRPLS